MAATRREFLIGGLQVTALWPALGGASPALGAVTERATSITSPRTLVVVELTGGNDALNMLVPHRQDAYFRARPTLAIPRAKLHAVNDDFGVHPEMSALAKLFVEGRIAAVHGVGLPSQERSHFRAMDIWQSAAL